MKVPSSFLAYRASNFVLENLSTYAGDDVDGNYDGDANCDYDQGLTFKIHNINFE